ncbi:MAG TPA: phosphatidate cytidylyltransferase [Gemmatales bacterium]|nr:phosphatidate cytidylyltransferase [Gemmatales bacterium]
MLRTRLWMGSVLVGLMVGVLVVDGWLAPWFPFLALVLLAAGLLGSWELISLLGEPRPSPWVCLTGVFVLLAGNWLPHTLGGPPLTWLAGLLAGVFMVLFALEGLRFRQPGSATPRLAATLLVVTYLGFLPSFLAQLRWRPDDGALALAAAIFITKACDIGAYFTGRALGRHPMAPVLSPKKTWEGAAGGLALATIAGLAFLGWRYPWWGAALLGLALGVAGMVGDLMESLLKRDSGQKDASQLVPGFGGVLDVVDALLFAGPVAYFGFMGLDALL